MKVGYTWTDTVTNRITDVDNGLASYDSFYNGEAIGGGQMTCDLFARNFAGAIKKAYTDDWEDRFESYQERNTWILNQMIESGCSDVEIVDDDDYSESVTLLELFELDEGDTEEDIKEWCEEESTRCHHDYDCCGNWYHSKYLLAITDTHCLIETIAQINV